MTWRIACVLLVGASFAGCAPPGAAENAPPPQPRTVVFLNAESEGAARTWSGERVRQHASEGEWSMKKVFGPKKGSLSVYGGFPVWPNDLTPYSHMRLDVYNPQQKSYGLQCAFKDKFMYTHKHYYGMAAPPPWPDGRKITPWAGYVELTVEPGLNHLEFSLDEMARRCGIDWRYIHHYWMWLPELQKSAETATLYFDNMRLVRRPGEAGKLSPEWRKVEPQATEKEKLLYGFESRYELWQWEWSGRKELVRKPGLTGGDYGMLVRFGDLGAKKWQYCARFGVRLGTWNKEFERHVWTGYDRLRLDVHNPADQEREVWIGFASGKGDERKEARRFVKVKPGDNALEFELAALAKEGVDLANVGWFEFKPRRDSAGGFGWMVLDSMRLVKD